MDNVIPSIFVPIRNNKVIEIKNVPWDLTLEEATKISNVILAYAITSTIDYPNNELDNDQYCVLEKAEI